MNELTTGLCPQTDRRTDGQPDSSINFVEQGYNNNNNHEAFILHTTTYMYNVLKQVLPTMYTNTSYGKISNSKIVRIGETVGGVIITLSERAVNWKKNFKPWSHPIWRVF